MLTLDRLIADHETVLLDAMGVLINKGGAIAHATQFVDHLNRRNQSYFILTNICGDTEQGICERLLLNGIPVASPNHVISAGSLVQKYIENSIPSGMTVAFIGPQSCRAVIQTGRHSVEACGESETFDVLAILDDEGFPFRETLETALSVSARKFRETGKLPMLLLANGDCAYPKDSGSYAFGSGIFALMLCEALKKLVGVEPEVISFGKPSCRMFSEAQRRSGTDSMMMIGDQMATDILGANNFGITSILVLTGLNARQDINQDPVSAPTYVIEDLQLAKIHSSTDSYLNKNQRNGVQHHVSI